MGRVTEVCNVVMLAAQMLYVVNASLLGNLKTRAKFGVLSLDLSTQPFHLLLIQFHFFQFFVSLHIVSNP